MYKVKLFEWRVEAKKQPTHVGNIDRLGVRPYGMVQYYKDIFEIRISR